MSKIIEVEQISKKYRVYHEAHGYSTLVDAISRRARNFIYKVRHPFQPLPTSAISQYEEFWALKDVSLSIDEGDRVGIIGRNGAGKSTLLKVLSRITEPTSGRIKIRGRVSSLLEVGTGFHQELTGRENIFLNGAILGMRHQEITKKFDEIVAFAEIENFLDTPVKRFSSGMYMRLGFAIAAHLDPDVLIVDEVLAVGDAQFQSKCLKKLNDLGSHGRTVLFVSHDIGSILTLCNKGIFLEKGCLNSIGPIDHCVNAYVQSCRLNTLNWEGIEGDEHVRFYRSSLTGLEPREFFYQGDRVQVEVEYEVLKPVQDLVLGIGVWNQRNQLLARSHTWDQEESYSPNVLPGRYKAGFTIDAGLFHEGEYAIKVDAFIYNKKKILNDEISLKFPVFVRNKSTRFSHSIDKSGVFLGNHWDLKMKI